MELVRSLSNSVKLFLSGAAEGEGEGGGEVPVVLDAFDCVGCDQPCAQHPWVPEGMLSKLNTTKPLLGKVKRAKQAFFICSGDPGSQWSAKPQKSPHAWYEHIYAEFLKELEKKLEQEEELKKKSGDTDSTHVATSTSHSSCVLYISSVVATSDHEHHVDNHLSQSSSGFFNGSSVDILCFPQHIRVHNVTADMFAHMLRCSPHQLQQEILTKFPWSFPEKNVTLERAVPLAYKWYLFVCTHAKRDKRCGVGGGLLLDELRKEVKKKNLESVMGVEEMSHVGGHAFAGNVLVYPGGHLYGRVTPCHAQVLIESLVDGTHILNEIYRGNQGLEW